MEKIIKLDQIRKPGWNVYLVTFKPGDIHPIEREDMEGRAVRIIAPDDEAMKHVLRSRFGNAFYRVHNEMKINKPMFYPNGLFETLVYQKPKA